MTGPLNTAAGRIAKSRAFISDEPLQNVTRDGRPYVRVKVRLTSYRSLPLSCIEAMSLKLDGKEIDPADLLFTINYTTHRLSDLPQLSHVWWFILDHADLLAPCAKPLAPGLHDVEGTIVTVEPYITAGRFSFYNSAKKRLPLETDLPEVNR